MILSHTTYTLLLALTGSAAAIPFVAPTGSNSAPNEYIVLEHLIAPASGWNRLPQATDLDAPMRLTIRMANPNKHVFEKRLVDISTPAHPDYGGHMTKKEIDEMHEIPEQTVNLVKKWLDSEGSKVSFDRDTVVVDTTLGKASKLLRAKYEPYLHEDDTEGKNLIYRTMKYYVPADLEPYIQTVQPTTMFGGKPLPLRIKDELKRRMVKRDGGTEITPEAADNKYLFPLAPPKHSKAYVKGGAVPFSACDYSITPDCLAELYGFDAFENKADPKNKIGHVGFLGQLPRDDDLEDFMRIYRPYRMGTFTCTSVGGGSCNTTQGDMEHISKANIDIQYSVGLTFPTENVFYSTAGTRSGQPVRDSLLSEDEPWMQLLDYLLKQEDLPNVLSFGYADREQDIPKPYAEAVCNKFAQLGARGVSVIFASGEEGVGTDCKSNDGKNTTQFVPMFPASCNFVTSVGGTFKTSPEQAAHFSGGGFSNYFPRPDYQESAVSSFLSTNGSQTFAKLFNPKGRGIPDVSAQAVNYRVNYLGKEADNVSGTSASAPTFASIISLLNGDRLSKGLKPLGFLNPWIYSNPGVWNDVITGANMGCWNHDKEKPTAAGFKAVRGWDPASGMGTPNFKKLLALSGGGSANSPTDPASNPTTSPATEPAPSAVPTSAAPPKV